MSQDIMSLPREGPYVGISRDDKVSFGRGKAKRTFRVLVYGAYNAMGLIGSEANGIAILDEDRLQVLADEIACMNTGWFGPSQGQTQLFDRITKLDWANFRDLVNTSGRNRYII